jgi:nicotinic acid phosphoribosyltransferase
MGLIQGDGMDEESIPELYKEYIKTGWAADNILTGSGGGLLYKSLDRDLNRWAIKPCEMSFNGVKTPVAKVPKSDPSKTSKFGDVKLHKMGFNSYITLEAGKEEPAQFHSYADSLETIFENGKFNPVRFEDVRERASKFY